jgi:hypothetical protein
MILRNLLFTYHRWRLIARVVTQALSRKRHRQNIRKTLSIYPEGYSEEAHKKASSGEEKKRRAWHDLISPGRTGGELAPAFSQDKRTGCCGFSGPNPSATLDKIPNQVVTLILERNA